MTMGDAQQLRLAVLDTEDLCVVSAHLQDAEVAPSDMAFLPRQARFALVAARFDWPGAVNGRFARCQTGLHFERVLSAARSGFPDNANAAPLRLIAIAFVPGDAPSGDVLLSFVGGARIKLTVECLEAEMRDLGPRWEVDTKPPALADAPL